MHLTTIVVLAYVFSKEISVMISFLFFDVIQISVSYSKPFILQKSLNHTSLK